MAITYPLPLPTTSIAKAVKFAPKVAVAQAVSPFTFQEEVFEHQGQLWEASFQLPPMQPNNAEVWVAWQLALNGTFGTFLMGDPVNIAPRGTGNGTPLIDGAGQQRSKELTTKGWAFSELVLKAGDWIQLPSYRLHKVMQDVTSDGAGLATIDIFPRVRDVLLDSDPIIIDNTVGVWRMKSNVMNWDIGEAQFYGINFEARESL